jgi:hypothetical protein
MLKIFFCFYCFCWSDIHLTASSFSQKDSVVSFVYQKFPSFAKNTTAYYFQIDKNGKCIYKTQSQLLKRDGFNTTQLNDSTTSDLFKKIDEIFWDEMTQLKTPSRAISQKINIQYNTNTQHINQFVGALPLMYNIKPVKKTIEKIIEKSKWKKTFLQSK